MISFLMFLFDVFFKISFLRKAFGAVLAYVGSTVDMHPKMISHVTAFSKNLVAS